MSHVSLAATAAYLPERWMAAAEVAAASGIPAAPAGDRSGRRYRLISGSTGKVWLCQIRREGSSG